MSRVGQVFMWDRAFAVVTEDLKPPREPGSTLTVTESKRNARDQHVYTMVLFYDSGYHIHPVERLADTLDRWESEGKRML